MMREHSLYPSRLYHPELSQKVSDFCVLCRWYGMEGVNHGFLSVYTLLLGYWSKRELARWKPNDSLELSLQVILYRL